MKAIESKMTAVESVNLDRPRCSALALISLASLAVLVFAGIPAKASDHSYGQVTLNISLTARWQVTDPNNHAIIRTARVSTKEVLRMLGSVLQTNLSGCTLLLRNDWTFGVTNQVIASSEAENLFLDVSRFFSITWGNQVWKGIVDPLSGPEGSGYGIMTLGFNDGQGNAFVVQGMAIEVSKYRTPSGGGFGFPPPLPFDESWNSWSVSVAGEGMLNGEFAIFQGMIIGRGQWW